MTKFEAFCHYKLLCYCMENTYKVNKDSSEILLLTKNSTQKITAGFRMT